jgi:hypothetical protein
VNLTPYNLVTGYNNFYEWGLSKEEPKELANKSWKNRAMARLRREHKIKGNFIPLAPLGRARLRGGTAS